MFTRNKKDTGIMLNNYFSRILIFFCVSYFLLGTEVSGSQEKKEISAESFASMTVLENGRKKPFDTYARNKLIQFSGKQKIKGSSANQWLARVLFNPSDADLDLIFLINNPEIADALGITPRVKRRYSFAELQNAFQKLNSLSESAMQRDQDSWNSFDKEVIRVRNNINDYYSLRSTFSFMEPYPYLQKNDTTLANLLGLSVSSQPSYVQLLYRSERISSLMHEIQMKSADSLTIAEMSIVMLAKKMYQTEKTVGNPSPHIIPEITPDGEKWYSLWGLINVYHTDAMPTKMVNLLFTMQEAYVNQSQQGFDEAVKQYKYLLTEIFAAGNVKLSNPRLELVYNSINPFLLSKIIYGIAALFSLLALSLLWKRSHQLSVFFCITGLILHTSGIIARMVIMSHPPVTNLYETFIFTAWVSVILGLVLEWVKIRPMGVVTSAVTGFIFLHIASRYSRDGDTLGMLAAVLDSSFWLTTHIVTIALGYAGFVAAGLIAHFYIFQKVFTKTDEKNLQLISRAVYGIFVFGFIFTIVGTVFGGMWADQSWGRFWGWDPKENGALLIILWGLIVLHSLIAGMIKGTGLAISAVIGVVLVMCTWVGVNLLGIGLHSYGFSSTGAGVLFMYIGFESVFLITSGIVLSIKSKGRHRNSVKVSI